MDNKKKQILEALELHNGIISAACKSIQMPRSTFYNWKDTDEEFAKAVEEINEVAIDYVESKLFEKIEGVWIGNEESEEGSTKVYKTPPSDTAIIFYLKTKAKKRGYVERSEVQHSVEENQTFQIGDQIIKF